MKPKLISFLAKAKQRRKPQVSYEKISRDIILYDGEAFDQDRTISPVQWIAEGKSLACDLLWSAQRLHIHPQTVTLIAIC